MTLKTRIMAITTVSALSGALLLSAPALAGEASAQDEFGPACATVPDNAAQEPTGTAVGATSDLSTLATAVTQAGLAESLNSAEAVTVFAPVDDAFAELPAEDLQALLADKDELTEVLTYHVVEGKITPDQLAGEHTTMQGDILTVTGSGTDYTVNDSAVVVCGNVETANGVVYLIDGVLMP